MLTPDLYKKSGQIYGGEKSRCDFSAVDRENENKAEDPRQQGIESGNGDGMWYAGFMMITICMMMDNS